MAVNYQRLLKRLDKKKDESFCETCKQTLSSVLGTHRSNLATPAQIGDQSSSADTPTWPSAEPEETALMTTKRRKNGPAESSSITPTNEESSTSQVGGKRKNKQRRKIERGLTTAATVVGMAGFLTYVDKMDGPSGSCPTQLVTVEQ